MATASRSLHTWTLTWWGVLGGQLGMSEASQPPRMKRGAGLGLHTHLLPPLLTNLLTSTLRSRSRNLCFTGEQTKPPGW